MTDRIQQLEDERRRTADRLARLRSDFRGVVNASRDSNADDEHDPEGATIAFERSQIDSLVRQAVHHLAEVDAALERVRSHAYGSCERCRRPIPSERLDARPVARTCVGCAAR